MSELPIETRRRSLPDEISVEIIARLPLRRIARFKSVCKEWRSLIESSYLRSLFVSLHRRNSSSSSWSLMFSIQFGIYNTEAIGFHGCRRWDLPKSPASYLVPFQPYPNQDYHYVDGSRGKVLLEVGFGFDDTKLRRTLQYYYVDSSHGLVWLEACFGNWDFKSFVGNPVTQEWVEIPQHPCHHSFNPSCLVTRVENGVVSSFKMISTSCDMIDPTKTAYVWRRVYVYSSETGTWTFKNFRTSCLLQHSFFRTSLSLNGMVYAWDNRLDDDDTAPGVIIALDLYAEDEEDSDQCRIMPLPVPYNKSVRRCLTTSGGDVIYVEVLDGRLKVWKLKNSNNDSDDGEWWQLKREAIDMASDCFPLGMNPLDTDLVYLWSTQHSCVVSANLRTLKFTLHKESETWSDSQGSWRVNTSDFKECVKALKDPSSVITLSQFVLPQWMDPVPRPPY